MRLRPYSTDDLPAVLDAWEHVSRTAHAFLPDDFFETEKHDIAHRWMPVADTTVVEAYVAGGRAVLSNGPFVAHSPLWGQAWLSSTGAARVDARAWAM